MPVLYIRADNGNFVPIKTIKGKDGKTPVRGEDYWTPEDQQQIINEVLGQGGGGEEEYEVIIEWTAPADWGSNMYVWDNLAHKKLIIIVDAPAGTADGLLDFGWNWRSLCYAQKGVRNGSKSKTVCVVETYLINDGETKRRYLRAECTENGYETDTVQNKWASRGYGIPGTLAFGEKTAIDQVMLRTSANQTLPEGTIITILGVRA